MNDRPNPLFNSAVILAAVTAALYSFSTAYYQGYLHVLRLDADMLDRNFHQVLYNGFLIALGPALVALIAYSVCALLIAHFLLPAVTDWLRAKWVRRRQYARLKRHILHGRKTPLIETITQDHANTLLAFCIAAVLFVGALAYFEEQGRSLARVTLARLDKPLPTSDLLSVTLENRQRSLLYLNCGARNCAGIEPITRVVYYFPQNGHSFQYSVPPKASPAPPAKPAS